MKPSSSIFFGWFASLPVLTARVCIDSRTFPIRVMDRAGNNPDALVQRSRSTAVAVLSAQCANVAPRDAEACMWPRRGLHRQRERAFSFFVDRVNRAAGDPSRERLWGRMAKTWMPPPCNEGAYTGNFKPHAHA
ncbi:hypothetical protein MRX96_013617 [Rhipicephalus microplus]